MQVSIHSWQGEGRVHFLPWQSPAHSALHTTLSDPKNKPASHRVCLHHMATLLRCFPALAEKETRKDKKKLHRLIIKVR